MGPSQFREKNITSMQTSSPEVNSELAISVAKVVKVAIAAVTSMWMYADTDIKILGILMTADFIISLFNRGVSILMLCRRLGGTVVIVGTIHVIFNIAKEEAKLNIGFDISAMVAMFYCIGEAVTILSKASAITRLPPVLLDWLSKAEGITSADKDEILALKLKQTQEIVALDLKISQKKDDGPKISLP